MKKKFDSDNSKFFDRLGLKISFESRYMYICSFNFFFFVSLFQIKIRFNSRDNKNDNFFPLLKILYKMYYLHIHQSDFSKEFY